MTNETPTCELRYCASNKKDLYLVYVDQNIEDGCYKTGICMTCAKILNLHPGSELPYDGKAGAEVNKKLKAAQKKLNLQKFMIPKNRCRSKQQTESSTQGIEPVK